MKLKEGIRRVIWADRWVMYPLTATVWLSVLGLLYYIFTQIPGELVMGEVQRVFYFHVASAVSTYLMVLILCVSSILLLWAPDSLWEDMGRAAASVALVTGMCVLGSGMVWGHSAWNTWWRWEPRLVSFLILWLILLAYVVTASMAEGEERREKILGAFGVLATLAIPAVVFSVKLLDRSQQLHPQVLESRGLTSTYYVTAFYWSLGIVAVMVSWLFLVRLRGLLLQRRVRELAERSYV